MDARYKGYSRTFEAIITEAHCGGMNSCCCESVRVRAFYKLQASGNDLIFGALSPAGAEETRLALTGGILSPLLTGELHITENSGPCERKTVCCWWVS
jgi:hypothetical protein